MSNDSLTLAPIGFARTPFVERAQAPRQPRAAAGVRGTIELVAGCGFEDALCDLEGWDYVWVIFWFDRNACELGKGWRPKVLPPRSTKRRGVFSTRSPHRPNPIGLSVLRLERVEGLVLHVSDVDLLDGTPVLDVKPYVRWTDAIPDARAGWLEDEELRATTRERPNDPLAKHAVTFSPLARAQLEFLREAGVEIEASIYATLSLGPQAHAYRRIRRASDGTGTLAVKEWRARFAVDGRAIEVKAIASGYRDDQPADAPERAPSRAAHVGFRARWP
ncbi:MAG: tRNA (N6-threonylcarbamoyladenosine(37)-N6)-methyltransferase TrmO [Polyangiales bacterium]